jgi:uncharacterized membrane protein
MPKKKNVQTQEGLEAPVKDTVFPETGAAQGAAAADQIPSEIAELITATLKVVIAQRKLVGLSTTLSSLTRAVLKALGPYVDGITTAAIREFIKREAEKMGYKIITAKVNHLGVMYLADTVLLYKDFDEIMDVIKNGRGDSFKTVITTEGIDPLYDKLADSRHD